MTSLVEVDMTVTDLTTADVAELLRYEAVIKRGLQTFVEVGNALAAIRDGRLYRGTHSTFDAYCQERWSIKLNYANKLISAAEVVENLGTIVPILPATETQARPLTRLAPEQQREVWPEVVETAPDGKVTASHVEQVVRLRHPKPIPAPELAKPTYVKPVADVNAIAAKLRKIASDLVEGDAMLDDLAEGREGWYHDTVLAYVPADTDPGILVAAAKIVQRERAPQPAPAKSQLEPPKSQFNATAEISDDEEDIIDIDPSKLRDARLREAVALHNALVGARHRVSLHFGELTGQHTLLPPFERAVAALLEPIDSLIKTLRNHHA